MKDLELEKILQDIEQVETQIKKWHKGQLFSEEMRSGVSPLVESARYHALEVKRYLEKLDYLCE